MHAYRGLGPAFVMFFCVSCLTLLGLVVLSSASLSFSGNSNYFIKQLMWLGFAVLAGIVAAFVNIEWLRRFTWWIAAATAVGLVLVLVPGIGVEVNGARRWVDLGFMRMQVSEFAKLGYLFVIAHYLAENQRDLDKFVKGFFIPSVWIGSVCLLILLEPDFGTAFLVGAVGGTLMFLAGVRLLYLVPSLIGACTLFGVAIFHDPVRLARIVSFLNVEANKSDGAYQLWQGILAFGAGGLDGVGLGQGRQQNAFLPEAHTDFIFSIVGEELGLFCTAGVVIAFGVFLCAGLWNLRKAPNLFNFTLVAGALLFVILQAIINMGVVTGLLPTKGMSLPFISYGGSNLVLMFVLCGLIFNCFRSWAKPPVLTPRDL